MLRHDMDCSFNEKQRRATYQASDEARLLLNEVTKFNAYEWEYDSPIEWFNAEVILEHLF